MPDYKCPTQPALSIAPDSEQYGRKPMIEAAFKFIGGERLPFSGDMVDVTSPVVDASTGERALIGRVAQFNEDDARAAVEAAATAWDRGQGPWPQMSLADRIRAIEQYVENLKVIREQVVDCLMWEIAKSASDAAKEFDRTIEFIALVIKKLKTDPTVNAGFAKFTEISGVTCQVRLGPIGVMLGLAAFNYPVRHRAAPHSPASQLRAPRLLHPRHAATHLRHFALLSYTPSACTPDLPSRCELCSSTRCTPCSSQRC